MPTWPNYRRGSKRRVADRQRLGVAVLEGVRCEQEELHREAFCVCLLSVATAKQFHSTMLQGQNFLPLNVDSDSGADPVSKPRRPPRAWRFAAPALLALPRSSATSRSSSEAPRCRTTPAQQRRWRPRRKRCGGFERFCASAPPRLRCPAARCAAPMLPSDAWPRLTLAAARSRNAEGRRWQPGPRRGGLVLCVAPVPPSCQRRAERASMASSAETSRDDRRLMSRARARDRLGLVRPPADPPRNAAGQDAHRIVQESHHGAR
jgi:hypothetical protein